MTHLPPRAIWRAAQSRAKACGLWLDMTADGVVHIYRLSDGHEEGRAHDAQSALSLLGSGEGGQALEQMEMAL